MLHISKKADYALFIMGQLVQRGALPGAEVVSAQEIASRSGLNKSVVANLLKDLTRGGLLKSVRGIHGGYRLGKPAEDISLGCILATVEGPFALVDCADATDDAGAADGGTVAAAGKHPTTSRSCRLMSFCPSKRPMQVLHSRIARLMDELRLPELVGVDARPQAAPLQPGTTQPGTTQPGATETTTTPPVADATR